MSNETTEHMALALSALGDFSIKIRRAGDWYASVRAEIKKGGCLESPTVSAPTPDAAVSEVFAIYSAPGTRVVLNAFGGARRTVTWNGFMWEDVA